ncbi:unnamed protein product, partial [Polarella glacialis]
MADDATEVVLAAERPEPEALFSEEEVQVLLAADHQEFTGDASSASGDAATGSTAIPLFTIGAPCGQVNVLEPKSVGNAISRHTTYLVSGQLRDLTFLIRRRYSDFEWFRKALSEHFPGIRVPPLPKKQVAGRFEESFVEARRAGLEEFLQRCFRIPQLCLDCKLFKRFLESSAGSQANCVDEE